MAGDNISSIENISKLHPRSSLKDDPERSQLS